MIETQIRNLVVPTSSHIPEIGSRLYIGGLPDSVTWPAAVMYSISRVNEGYDTTIRTDRMQFSVYADYLSSADTIVEAIKTKVKRYHGQQSTLESYMVINTAFDNISYLYDSNVLKHVKILDVLIRYMEV